MMSLSPGIEITDCSLTRAHFGASFQLLLCHHPLCDFNLSATTQPQLTAFGKQYIRATGRGHGHYF